jgi:hypothetical protein
MFGLFVIASRSDEGIAIVADAEKPRAITTSLQN